MHSRLPKFALIIGLFSLSPLTAMAQQDLGMKVFGDDDTAFGLLIANWQDDDRPGLLAPGLTEEKLEPADPWQLEMQLRAQQAIAPTAGPQR